ncbi:hypothetical protein ACFLRQ_03200, partial [Bacteroidota bacterium]
PMDMEEKLKIIDIYICNHMDNFDKEVPLTFGLQDKKQKDEFWKWFKNESRLIDDSEINWNKYPPSNLSFRSERGKCHANSLFNATEHGYELYCGLVILTKDKTLTHSFNYTHNVVFDATTFYNNDEPFYNFDLTKIRYVGIKLPDHFIKKITALLIEKNIPKNDHTFPLLSLYFINYLSNEFPSKELLLLIESIRNKILDYKKQKL